MIDINYHSVRTKSIVFLVLLLGVQSQVIPSMLDAIKRPVHVQEGDDALLTCVVRGAGDRVVLWKKDDRERSERRVLTAGEATTTPDKRFAVLHESGADSKIYSAGGDVWVLVIRDAKPTDSGVYICELNSEPVVRSFHKLNVLPRGLVPPETNKGGDSYSENFGDIFTGKVHNYTDCCSTNNVSSNCLGYCSIQSILDGNTGQDPENCERDFPSIVRCMADRRNHVPCCIQEKVPDICQDVCRGEYTVITDNIKTHFSCTAYTESTLACVVEGIELLPSPPEDVEVEALTEKSLKVSWRFPTANHASVTAYHVMFKTVRSFDAHLIDTSETSSPTQSPETNEVVVPSDKNSTTVSDLIPFTMYEISVTAVNSHGSSLPSYSIRSLTLNPGKAKSGKVADPPKLPDITKCCIDKGVTHASCVDKLCNPITAGQAKVTDLMICAPWAADTFKCLINGKDHTPCCKRRGLPELCQGLCSGNVTTLDFNYFKCLRYMSDYTNCLLQGYGVLPGSPTRVHVTNIATEYAIVHWAAPLTLGDTVQHYNIRYKKFFNDDNEYAFIEKVHPPFILEDLESNTNYEFYVEAVNTHGVGEPSFSLIFQTQSKKVEDEIEKSLTYNVTECCAEVGVSEVCMPLCSYDANMSDIKHLAKICLPDFHKLLRCGAGGRNHEGCCARRGVSAACLPLCTGVIVDSILASVKNCMTLIGNIVQCFEEGTGLLPGPIGELHATKVTDQSITIQWSGPVDGANVTGYIVYYQNKNESNIHETPLKLENQMNVTATVAELKDLEVGGLYSIFVVAVNAHGTSLPSSILIINDTHLDVGDGVDSITSPPHSLAVADHSATFVTISWHPPEFSHPQEILTYTLYHTSTGKEGFEKVEISVTSHTLEHLSPNTQYIIYVTANSSHGVSLPSETLIAWTDPAYPAFVEPPTVHPINLVMEGSSMTILCIAMGTPMPTISLYISGRLVRQEITRHMVTVIHNVTRDMDQISCYADNGFGTPMQASRKITISHVPTIQASGITMAAPDESVALECRVAALPRPQMAFWRDPDGRVPVIQGPKYDIKVIPDNDDDTKYIMRLTINKISEPEEGDYFCHAENAFGSAVQAVSVRIRNFAASHNVTQCCIEQNVTAGCMDACSFYLDIDAVIDKPECIGDFDKLMKCAADGSDHRTCCAGWGVPRRCLDWCRGEPLLSTRVCVLTYTRQIVGCFHEGREKLPGPPQNVHLSTVDSHSVKISWDPPVKNPHTVKVYRVFWRASGDKTPDKIDTIDTELTLTDLKEGISYECVVKAGNRLGTSTLTEPIKFTMGDKFITSTSSVDNDSSNTGVAVGIAMACIFVAAILILSVWLIRNKKGTITWNQFIRNTKMLGFKSQGGVAFENPSYLKETNSEPAVNNESQNISQDASATPKIVGIPSVSGGTGWRQESLQVPQEVNPTLYEELKLGHDGAGFKRLKP